MNRNVIIALILPNKRNISQCYSIPKFVLYLKSGDAGTCIIFFSLNIVAGKIVILPYIIKNFRKFRRITIGIMLCPFQKINSFIIISDRSHIISDNLE